MPRHTLVIFSVCGLLLAACGPVRFSGSSNTPSATTVAIDDSGNTQTPSGSTRSIHYNGIVTVPNNKLDILLIIDNSSSMLSDSQKLASRMSAFLTDLQGSSIDWQMCATVTNTQMINGSPHWGASVYWSNYTPATGIQPWVLKSTANLQTIFTNTINTIGAGWAGTDDERGIKAAWWHLDNGDPHYANASSCYRNDAAISMIVISDEDERSIGGVQSQAYYANEYQALESDDLPANLTQKVQNVFGANKRFTFNSIIVKPSDSTCLGSQDAQGTKSHYGSQYANLSNLTGGGISSICESDYSANLNYFKNLIQTSIASIPLDCKPIGAVEAAISPNMSFTTTIQGASIIFSPQIPVGSVLDLKYQCAN